ncbi:hypothetical protein [Brevibacterium moorei]|uniref:hypothetical protein n=1 Tax=Brevibacterium moorei TaxID=2968457 RepID=UPI00211B8654|nr:hypothetical protein [Brevibacterium sp. 68QC2CO]MCQ9385089.1 hypothetical protein [Brevibacterium sp. 68QC2CO]
MNPEQSTKATEALTTFIQGLIKDADASTATKYEATRKILAFGDEVSDATQADMLEAIFDLPALKGDELHEVRTAITGVFTEYATRVSEDSKETVRAIDLLESMTKMAEFFAKND